MVVQTLKKKVAQQKNKAVIVDFEEVRKKNNIVNFDGDLNKIINELLKQNNPEYGIAMQMLSAKEIEKTLQSNFKLLKFEVKDVENETSKRIGEYIAPERYMYKPTNDECKTFLEELQNSGDVLLKEGSEVVRWSKTKSKFQFSKESQFYTSDKEYSVGNTPKAIKINITRNDGKVLLKRPIFTMPGIFISNDVGQSLVRNIAIGGDIPTFGSYYSRDYSKDNLYKIIDLNYLISLCKVLEMCVQYIDKDPSFLYNKNCSYYNMEYTIKDVFDLLEIGYLVEHKKFMSNTSMSLLCECAIAVTHIRDGEILTKKYQKEVNSEYARSFETKKNIPDKTKSVMKNNRFLDNFTFVELDELTDVDKFYLIENEFMSIKEASNIDKYINKNAEIRFRRLGQHKSSGLYYPKQRCICIDINSPSSFMHELAHHIDNTMAAKQASLDADFRIIAIMYKKALEDALKEEESKEVCNYYKRKKGYFHTPTEIFARCFELHLKINKGIVSSLLPEECNLTLKNGYPKLNEDLLSRIKIYFENIFTIEDSLNTTTPRAEQVLLSYIIPNNENNREIEQSEDEISTTIQNNIKENIISTIEPTEIISEIVPEHNGDGANYFFRIVHEALATMPAGNKPKKRHRKLNRCPIDEGTITQLSLL